MGIFDSVISSAIGSALGGQSQSQGGLAMQVIGSLIQQHGGLGGLMGQLQQGGLGNQVGSWVSPGQNQEINGGDLESALGGNAIGQVASQLGIDPSMAGSLAAQFLPQLINHATPNGNIEEAQHADLGGIAGSLLKNLL